MIRPPPARSHSSSPAPTWRRTPPLEPGTPTLGEGALEGFSLSGAPSTAVAYQCFTSVADPGGPFAYRYGRMELPAPPGLRQPEDDLIRLTYRLWTEAGELVRLANCWVPRSRAAVEWSEAWFRTAEGDRNIRWSGPFSKAGSGTGQDDEIGIAGSADGDCVEENSFENPCPIDAVIVDPGDDDSGSGDPWDPGDGDSGGDDPCYDCYGDEDPGGGGWNPGDSDGCDPDAIDGPESCRLPPCDAPGDSEFCDFGFSQMSDIHRAIEQIDIEHSFPSQHPVGRQKHCSDLHDALLSYRNRGGGFIGHTSAYSQSDGYFHWGERISLHHTLAWQNFDWLTHVVAHEGGHHVEWAYAIQVGENEWEAGRNQAAAAEWAEECTGTSRESWNH